MNKKILCLLLTLLLLLFSIPVFASTSPNIIRLAGDDRTATAIEIAKHGWSQSDYAILAYDKNFPDALGVAPLAKKYDAPILLTLSSQLNIRTKQALLDLKVKHVIIVGGTGVLSARIESDLQSMGMSFERISGSDRYETSVKIAQKLGATNELIVATGEDYPDALSIAPIAAIKQIPIILVPGNTMPDSVKSYINSISVNKTYVIGGTNIISESIANQFPNPERITGATAYDRNIAIIDKFGSDFTGNNIYIATGNNFADALAGTVLAARNNSSIVLVGDILSSTTQNYLNQNLGDKTLNIFGGEGAVKSSIFNNLTFSQSSSQNTPTTPTITNITELKSFLEKNYSTLQTCIGQTKFTFDIYENTFSYTEYDYWIQVGYEYGFFEGAMTSIKYTDEQKNQLRNELKTHQENLAKAVVTAMSNKKFYGGYFDSWYRYPTLRVDLQTRRYYSWKNYDEVQYTGDINQTYNLAKPSTFRWWSFIDDDL